MYENCLIKYADILLDHAQIVSKELETKHKIEFNFDKIECRRILEKIVNRDSLKYCCIAGGYFTKLNGQTTSPDIYIYTGRYFYPSIDFLNSFLNEEYREKSFDQLGFIAPQGVMARKTIIFDNKEFFVNFSYVNFPKSTNHRIQLLGTYDLEPCKIIYLYAKNSFYCSEWFYKGGSMIAENHTPPDQFLQKYRQKGFHFEENVFLVETDLFKVL
ncbi:hypothetical protein BpHYR1_040384 [Brachionus plicatilis]|uniref:Uncharacterized protein n=1 Tax=Brachionus plicatilis TaxID=10195 RepID=A0A3M7RAV3_BRAPC|nr:hypothetical protein BpHYR1_040384 [Brachionus plicatilis]